MDTKCRINLIGLEKDEIKGAIEAAAMILSLDVSLLKNFQYNAKTFLQRRKIGGQDTLVYVALLPNHQSAGASLFPMTAGLSVLMGMLMQTPQNGSTSSEGFHFYRQSFDTVGMALAAFEGCAQLLMKEVGEGASGVVSLSKETYDPFNETYRAIAKVNDLTDQALNNLRIARQEALSFASNDTVSDIVDIFDGIGDVLIRAQTRIKRNLREIALRMKVM